MKKKDIVIGETYIVKVSGKLAHVRVVCENPHGGWDGLNLATRRDVRIKSAARLRRPVGMQMEHVKFMPIKIRPEDLEFRRAMEKNAAAGESLVLSLLLPEGLLNGETKP